MRFRKRAEDHVKVDVDAAASAGAGRARQGARGRASRDRDRRNDKVGRSPEKSHQLTRGGDRQTIHELRQRLSTGSICRLGDPRSSMDHAGFFHETRVKLGWGCGGLDKKH